MEKLDREVTRVAEYVRAYQRALDELYAEYPHESGRPANPRIALVGRTEIWPCKDAAVVLVFDDAQDDSKIHVHEPSEKTVREFFLESPETGFYLEDGTPSSTRLEITAPDVADSLIGLAGDRLELEGKVSSPEFRRALIVGWGYALPDPKWQARQDYASAFRSELDVKVIEGTRAETVDGVKLWKQPYGEVELALAFEREESAGDSDTGEGSSSPVKETAPSSLSKTNPTREVIGVARRCIYCGVSEELQEEHVVPYGLDGSWVIEEASCRDCADITSRVELDVLRAHLLRTRAGLSMRTRRKKQRPSAFPINLRQAGKEESHYLSVKDQPVFMVLPLYDWPECVRVEERREAVDIGGIKLVGGDVIQVAGKPVENFKKWLTQQDFSLATISECFKPVSFARMLAKIAYGFAVAEVGFDSIKEAYVLPGILGEAQDIGRWVGCDLDEPLRRDDVPHDVSVRVVDGDILARVNLFARFGTQEYLVAVGRKKGEA